MPVLAASSPKKSRHASPVRPVSFSAFLLIITRAGCSPIVSAISMHRASVAFPSFLILCTYCLVTPIRLASRLSFAAPFACMYASRYSENFFIWSPNLLDFWQLHGLGYFPCIVLLPASSAETGQMAEAARDERGHGRLSLYLD